MKKAVFVTGATIGTGLAIARKFASDGYGVFITSRDGEKAQAVAKTIGEEFGVIAKGYGLSRAKQALFEKRIPKEFWEDALADYPDQTERIVEFLRLRLDEDADERDVRRATDALLRRGHSYQEIRRAMEQLTFDTDFQEDF